MSKLYFFDTYAFIEVIRGNTAYVRFEDENIMTSIFNLAELNYILKKEMPYERADAYIAQYEQLLMDVTVQDVKKAMTLKSKHRKLSIPDSIGYTMAQNYGAVFVTGDSDFTGFKNVLLIR